MFFATASYECKTAQCSHGMGYERLVDRTMAVYVVRQMISEIEVNVFVNIVAVGHPKNENQKYCKQLHSSHLGFNGSHSCVTQ